MEKFGITTFLDANKENNYVFTNAHYICMCGHSWEVDPAVTTAPVCEKCGNTDFTKRISDCYYGGKITSGARLEVIEKGDWGFIVKQYKVVARYNRKDRSLKYEGENEMTITFDFRSNVFKLEGGGRTVDITTESLREFFSEIDDESFMRIACTEKMRNFIEFGKSQFGRGYGYGRYHGSSGRAFLCNSLPILTSGYTDVQILCNAGFSASNLKNYYDIARYHHGNTPIVNRSGTRPHEILMLPKYLVKYAIDYDLLSSSSNLEHLRSFDKKFGADGVKNIFLKMDDEADKWAIRNFINNAADDFVDMVDRYHYNPQQLISYVFRDVKLQQGIVNPKDALTTIKDYMRMMTTMELNPDKYTKSLKKDHDIALMNYKTQEDEFTKKEFSKVVESDGYADLEYKTGEYAFVTPKTPKEIVREGDSLSHCVASYVKDVVKGKCKIFFLRKKDELDKSLITIELRGNRVLQARGFGNRDTNAEEKKLIKKWAEKKKLEVAC